MPTATLITAPPSVVPQWIEALRKVWKNLLEHECRRTKDRNERGSRGSRKPCRKKVATRLSVGVRLDILDGCPSILYGAICISCPQERRKLGTAITILIIVIITGHWLIHTVWFDVGPLTNTVLSEGQNVCCIRCILRSILKSRAFLIRSVNIILIVSNENRSHTYDRINYSVSKENINSMQKKSKRVNCAADFRRWNPVCFELKRSAFFLRSWINNRLEPHCFRFCYNHRHRHRHRNRRPRRPPIKFTTESTFNFALPCWSPLLPDPLTYAYLFQLLIMSWLRTSQLSR